MTDAGQQATTAPGQSGGGKLGLPPIFAHLTADLQKRGDMAMALGILCILTVLLLPMPSWLLDFSLSISITLSVIVLMTVIFIRKPLEFNGFPTVLLIATILRLALNVASTRLILANGHTGPDAAGKVIEAFGSFVMGGNFVIGLILFAILVVVNFVVITKGATRIAEVAARFTLDAMPGKQMAIDADLSTGLIDEDEARKRRDELQEESAFFGAMDGASKFVRGDAVAGLIITFINVVGGIVIGTMQMEMSMGDAASTYTLLSIGDGLVSQIPALIISTGAGILVSKAGTTGPAEKVFFGQLSAYPGALGMTAGLLVAMAVLPGIPFMPFMTMALLIGGAAFLIPRGRRKQERARAQEVADEAAREQRQPREEPISNALVMDQVRIELGYALLPLVNGDLGTQLTDQIKALRRQLASELGFIIPAVRIQDNVSLGANTYAILIKEIETARGQLRPQMYLCMDPEGRQIALPGEATVEPTFGLPAMWIPEEYKDEAGFKGYTVVDAATVITTHLTEVIKDSLDEMLSFSATKSLLDGLPPEAQKLVADVIPSQINIAGLQRVLQALLGERISIRDLPTILEAIAEASAFSRQTMTITEHVRLRLGRQICDAQTGPAGYVPLITMSPDWEQAFGEALVGQGEERQLAMAPSDLQNFMQALNQAFEKAAMQGETPVLLTSSGVRPYVRSVIERFRPQTFVMSQNEVHPKARIKTVGQV